MEQCDDYLAPNDSAIGPPLDHAEDRVARDRRIFGVEAHGGALMIEVYLCGDPGVSISGHDSCKTRADTSESLGGPRESGPGPDGGHRSMKRMKIERKPHIISIAFFYLL